MFVVVELKMDEIDQTKNQLAVDEEGRLLEIPKKLSEAEELKLDQLKEAVLEREIEIEEKEREEKDAGDKEE